MKLKALKREISGKKVKSLRKVGMAPASIYGPKRKSTSIQVSSKDFFATFEKAGYNKIFDLDIEGETKASKVLVKDVQLHPVKDFIYSVSFYQIDEDSKITVEVPVVIEGESEAVKQNLGFLVTPVESVAVYCLPKDIPDAIRVDISTLINPGDSIPIHSIPLGADVVLDSNVDPSTVLASIALPQKEEEVEAPALEGEGVEGEEGVEGAEGEQGAEGTGKESGEKPAEGNAEQA